MSHHNPPPLQEDRDRMLDACEADAAIITSLMNNTDEAQRRYPTVPLKRSQMKRSVGHIRTKWFETYWEYNERFRLLSYWQTANQGKAFMDSNY